jgi:ribosomal protein L3 glutamine methyltransferase
VPLQRLTAHHTCIIMHAIYSYRLPFSTRFARYHRRSVVNFIPKSSKTLKLCFDEVATRLDQANLVYGQGTVDAWEEAAIILTHHLKLPTNKPMTHMKNMLISSQDMHTINETVQARIRSKSPLAYIIHIAYQQGYSFYVDRRTLIPRSFIGEILANKSLWSKKKSSAIMNKEHVHMVLDMCCGSGCLGILAYKLLNSIKHADFIDISSDALDVARINLQNHHLVDRARLFHGNLFEALKNPYLKAELHTTPTQQKYDLILCNPPYVDANSMKTLPIEFQEEPVIALNGGDDGLKYVDTILLESSKYLSDNGILMVEIGRCSAALMKKYPQVFRPRKMLLRRPYDYPSDQYARWIDTRLSQEGVFVITKAALARLEMKH